MTAPARLWKLRLLILTLAAFGVVTDVSVEAQTPSTPNRVAANPNLAVRSRLTGHLPSWAKQPNDVGEVPDSKDLELTFVLSRSPSQQAQFNQLLADQQSRTSPRYHRWLTPQQIGDQYGPTKQEVNVLTSWLTGQGFRLDEVTPSRMFVRASATAGIAADALSTTFRMFRIPGSTDGKSYVSATTEPSIPQALTPIVAAIAGLTQLPEEPHPLATRAAPTPLMDNATHPETTLNNGEHIIAPGDFATIYNLKPVYQDGFDGTGQRVAIMGLSRVDPSDITNFEARVDQPSELPNVVIPPLGADPGLAGDPYQLEATLDVERVVGTAPGAKIDLIVTCSDSTSSGCTAPWNDGVFAAANYNIQTLLDPIMTISFSGCEAGASPAYVMQYDTLFSQAAAEGISVLVSSGDAGAAGCATHDAAPVTSTLVKSTNLLCSSGSVTCVGGTEFAETSNGENPSSYWGTRNSANQSSAIRYIPEGAWNQPTGTKIPFVVEGTGGGVSAVIPRPPFQVGVGVPVGNYRTTPDVSFSSASHDAYFGCYADPADAPSTPNPCVPNPTTNSIVPNQFYGTSAATPSMAGITALLNQKLGGSQGNLNPLLYSLAANPGNGVFNDVTVSSSGVTGCTVSVPSMCNNSVPSANALTGGLAGYVVSAGYDQATGWGSIDVANLLSAATSVMSFTVNPASSSLSISAGAAQDGQDALTLSSMGGFRGQVALTCAISFSGTGSAADPPICSFLDPYVTLVSGGTGTATMIIGRVAPNLRKGVLPADISLLAVLLAGLPAALLRFRRRNLYWVLVLGIGLSCLSGCGNSGITKGTYNVVVTGTAMTGGTTMTSSTTIDLTVQ
jgi:pseudomonalisin